MKKSSNPKIIFRVRGVNNCGKSTTIMNVFSKLLNSPALPLFTEHWNVTIHEARAIIKTGGVVIGIESRGDSDRVVRTSLALFKESGCDLVLCATRSKGRTVTAVDEFAASNKSEIHENLKYRSPPPEQQRDNTKFSNALSKAMSDSINSI